MRLALAGTLALLLAPASAAASTARVDAYDADHATIVYLGGRHEANQLHVHGTDTALVLSDPGADIRPGRGCMHAGPHAVTCSQAGRSVYSLIAVLGVRDDSITSDGPSNDLLDVDGGGGNDVLDLGGSSGSLHGATGNDVLTAGDLGGDLDGGPGADTLTGGDGGETLRGGPGPDSLDGGDGEDTVGYEDHTRPVKVDLGTQGSKAGSQGEGDMIANVENALGSRRADRLTAGAGGGFLAGLGDDDVLHGGSGPDRLAGDDGDDLIEGRGGADAIGGGPGRDDIEAGAGDDNVESGDGIARDGRYERDDVACGSGTDFVNPRDENVRVQPLRDAIDLDCETVAVSSHLPTIVNLRNGLPLRALRTRLWCSAPERCRVRIAARAGGELAGSAERGLRDGKRRKLAVPLSDQARERLDETGVLRLRLSVVVRWGRHLHRRHATGYTLIVRRSSLGRAL